MFDEKELIVQCQAGNRKAEKQLFDTYSSLFMGICMRYADSEAEAEDMLISGFTKIFTSLGTYQSFGSFEGWMKNIIVHNAIDLIRSRPRWNLSEDVVLQEPSGTSEIHSVFAKEDLVKAIRQLPLMQRSIFNLYIVEGFAHKEIAQMLEMNESTVRVYYSKAKKSLKEILKDYA